MPDKANLWSTRGVQGSPGSKAESHEIAVRDFGGTAELTLDAINPASLQMTIQAASLEETGAVFTPEQKGIINKELKEIVLETAKFPEITFKSTDVKGGLKNGQFDLKIGGDITLHGVTPACRNSRGRHRPGRHAPRKRRIRSEPQKIRRKRYRGVSRVCKGETHVEVYI